MRIRLEATLPAPVERAWQELADWQAYPHWMPDVAWVRPVGPQRGLGMRLAVRTRVLGIPLVTDTMAVTAWEPPTRMAISHQGLVRGSAEWLLEPAGDGTLFRWIEELRMAPPLLGEVALTIYRPILIRTFRRSIRNLAARLATAR